jgi:hypothetical protein
MGKTFHILEKDFIWFHVLLQRFKARNPQRRFSFFMARSWRCAR